MQVNVEDRLKSGLTIVDADVRGVGQLGRSCGLGDALPNRRHAGQCLGRGVGQIDGVLFGHHQGVAAGEGADVEEGQIVVVFVDPDGRGLAGDDRAEHTGHDVTR